ncbi:MAG TPA: crossover junction endodeoxyribonuclease RuvC [Bacteroidetes bacterium]|nr:crossover junction endodeoxyribonuclease RuvC [Bacteroidota bacterium]
MSLSNVIKILGIDPGTNIMGFGVVSWDGNTPSIIEHGILRINDKSPFDKLKHILNEVSLWIKKYGVDHVAIEAPFYDKNAQSMLKLGRAQGVAIASSINMGVGVTEYAPKKIKLALTGKGFSSKEQVQAMVTQILALKKKPETLDASDALAVAVCHCYQQNMASLSGKNKSYKGWSDYIDKNPGKKLST